MIAGLDSASEPSAAQALAARTVGIKLWSGYLATQPNVGLFHPWSQQGFENARLCGSTPIAYCSGWDDPTALRARAAAWNLRLCLDIEGGIRGNGPWAQNWLDESGAGVYGNAPIHRLRAAFHVLAAYPGADPQATWPSYLAQPPTPCGWQFQGTHTEFGVGVDRGWFDDWFSGLYSGGGSALSAGFPTGGKMLTFRPGGPGKRFDMAYLWQGEVWHIWGDGYSSLWAPGAPAGDVQLAKLEDVVPGGHVAEILGLAWDQPGDSLNFAVIGSDGKLYGQSQDISGTSSGWRALGAAGSPSLQASTVASGAVGPKGDKGDPGKDGKDGVSPATGTIAGPITVKLD